MNDGHPTLTLLLLGLCVLICLRWWRWMTHRSIHFIRGPPTKSLLFGNLGDIVRQENVGDLDFACVREFGGAWRLRAPFRSDVLVIADPEAIHHIFTKSGYAYPKTAQMTVLVRVISGHTVGWAPTSTAHARYRRALTPGFSSAQLTVYVPLFNRIVRKVSYLWKDSALGRSPEGTTIDVSKCIRGLTLDIIGEAAFDYDFEALDDGDNALASAYRALFSGSTRPSRLSILYQALWTYLPPPLLEFVERLPFHQFETVQKATRAAQDISSDLIARKTSSQDHGKDIISLLLRANGSSNPSLRLTHDEVVGHIAGLTFAGSDTSGHSLVWMLYELAHAQAFQDDLRAEIRQKRADLSAHGRTEFTVEDFDSIAHLQACIKETLRFHPVVYKLDRLASQDDVIPLAEPIATSTGEVISQIPVAKGQVVITSIAAYNRLPSLWGQDADKWNPKRFMAEDVGGDIRLGTYANLMTFSAGVRGCIGMKFAIIEMQAIIVELIENFKFEPPRQDVEIVRCPTPLMISCVKGESHKGSQMPLHVSLVPTSC